eukprot:TRINITY_DN9096_c0_g1_i1.p1 TRINITY_DN9096_c0_g1~~TRINITY_DN9096_c0_g1_i1.p1  ORF type:complete len:201 (+),score=48.60 TRINITY_DN9096_c0_g1_i1:244-846(+)
MKSLKLRGQAWIVFRDTGSSSMALRSLNNFLFYDKPLKVSFAKSKSDMIKKMEGTWVPKEKVPRPPRVKPVKVNKEKSATQPPQNKKRKLETNNDKKETASNGSSAQGAPTGASGLPQPKPQPANNILFVQNLPDAANEMMLSMLFQQFPGFKEVRMAEGKKGIAFVEFNTAMEAAVAMNGLQHFKITPTNLMVISFAKK